MSNYHQQGGYNDHHHSHQQQGGYNDHYNSHQQQGGYNDRHNSQQQQGGYNDHHNSHQQQSQESGVITDWAFHNHIGYYCGKVKSDRTGQKIFVDSRDCQKVHLSKGDRISFTVVQGQRGSKATNISKQSGRNQHGDDGKDPYRNPPHDAPHYPPRNAGVLYFQTAYYDEKQMQLIKKKFGTDYRKGPKMLFGDNYTDRFRPRNTPRQQSGGQSKVMGHYDTSFGFGIPTSFNSNTFHFTTQSFETLMAKLFSELRDHLRNGGDVIIPYPSKKDLESRPHKYFKKTLFGLSKSDQLVHHNLGTGIAPLSVKELMIIQDNIDKLKDVASSKQIVNQRLYTDNDSNYNPRDHGGGHGFGPDRGSNRGGVFFQSEWYTKEQLQHIENKYTVRNGPIMLFNDNETDKQRWRTSSRSNFTAMARVMGHYDRTYGFGITTMFKGGYTPPVQQFQQTMDKEFKQIREQMTNGRDVVIPAPSAKDIQRDGYKYYRHGRQEIFHNIGTELPPKYVDYIQRKVTDLKRDARVDKVVDYYDFSAANTYIREQRQQQQHGSVAPWECHKCYHANPRDETKCSSCGTIRGMNDSDEKGRDHGIDEKRRDHDRSDRRISSDDDESDDGIDENTIRKRWGKGDEVEVYSKGQSTWFKGTIIEIGRDSKGEYLSVQYFNTAKNKNTTKDLDRYAYGGLRPIKSEKKRKTSDIVDINLDELDIEDPEELLRRFEQQNNELRQLLQTEQMKHEFALSTADLEQKAARNQLKTILKGKELKIKGLENTMTQAEMEREKRNMEEQARQQRLRQQQQMDRELDKQKQKQKEMEVKMKKIQKEMDETGVSVCWEWKGDDDTWRAYDDHLIQQLNGIQINSRCMLTIKGRQYEVTRTSKDVATQRNTQSNVTRQCRRRIVVAQQISWEWQENDGKWKQYADDIAKAIEKLDPHDANNNKYTYTFAKNSQTYEITRQSKGFAVQINTQTNVSRQVRRIKSGDDGANIYPHFWDMSKIKKYDQAEIVDIKLTDTVAQEVIKKFSKTASNKTVVKLEAIMNQCLFDRYTHERDMMLRLKGGDKKKVNERELYHGTKNDATVATVRIQGFRKEFTSVAAYGEGTYFARDASYSVGYSSPLANTNPPQFRMFVCKVLCGEPVKGVGGYKLKSWPLKNGNVVDCLCNNVAAPSIFVMHSDSKIYPMWCLYFQ